MTPDSAQAAEDGPARVLLVDDEAAFQRLGAAWLRGLGHEVAVAGDGDAAVARFGGFAPDVVLLDLAMPPRFDPAAGLELVPRFAPVPVTHGLATLAAIPRLCAINSAVEVDLLGQADAETVGGRAVSGVGGLGDFLRGAQASVGGLAVVALAASAQGGTVSRIVPRLSSGVVSAGRTEVGLVVTEHGVADLRRLDLDGRARALIAVAAPQHREGLERAWAERA